MNTAVKNEVMLPEVVGQLIKFAKAENMNKESDDMQNSANMLQICKNKLLH